MAHIMKDLIEALKAEAEAAADKAEAEALDQDQAPSTTK